MATNYGILNLSFFRLTLFLLLQVKNEVIKVLFQFNHPELFDVEEEDKSGSDDDESNTLGSLTDGGSIEGFSEGLPQLGPDNGAMEKFSEKNKIAKEEELNRNRRASQGLSNLPQLKMYSEKDTKAAAHEAERRKDRGEGKGDKNETSTQFDEDGLAAVPSGAAPGGSEVFDQHSSIMTVEPTLKNDIAICKREAFICNEQYLTVCRHFKKGTCAKTNCPKAHPGLRDDAELYPIEGKGKRGMFFVKVCFEALIMGFCKEGNNCQR